MESGSVKEMTEKEIRRTNAQEQLRHDRYIRRTEKKAVKKQAKDLTSWLVEFSKKVVIICVLLHLAVFLYSAVAMWHFFDISALPTIVMESSDILKTCVFGYMIKAGLENWQKIKGSQKKKNKAAAQEQQEEGVG